MPEPIDREPLLEELHELIVQAPWLGEEDEEEWWEGYKAGLRVAEDAIKNAIVFPRFNQKEEAES